MDKASENAGAAAAAPADAKFGQLLDEKIAEARAQIDRLTLDIQEATLAAKDFPADDEHDPEGSTLTLERAREVTLLESTEEALGELLAAKARFDAGTYGRCEKCGKVIPDERLEARPEARFCMEHAGSRRH